MNAKPAAGGAVRTRRVHYFSGFDPRGSRHYHQLCRAEAGKPQPDGSVLQVGSREKLHDRADRWAVEWRQTAGSADCVRTEHVFMSWADVIRAHWARTPAALVRDFVQAYIYMFGQVGAGTVWRMYRPIFKAGILPLALLLLPLLLVLLAAWAAPWAGAAALAATLLLWGLAVRGGMLWLIRICAFYRHASSSEVRGLDECTQNWTETIVRMQQDDPVDEVLLVGHSVGAFVMLPTVHGLLKDPRWLALRGTEPTNLLTLGHSLPMVAIAPAAHIVRQVLTELSHAERLCWWDVSARIDPLCFYRLHPLAGSSAETARGHWPVLHAARFMHMYTPSRWARIRTNKLQAHFLYLMTSDKPGNFSWADVFYGPRSLEQQIAASGFASND
jgi:hypothetical protein